MWTHTEVVPREDPKKITVLWTIGPVMPKDPAIEAQLRQQPHRAPLSEPTESEITLQLTADQQVKLSVSGQDKYGNPVEITGDTQWISTDPAVVLVGVMTTPNDPTQAMAIAAGQTGTASVTCTNDANYDGTGDFMGSLAIDVVAGQIAEITIAAGEPEPKTPNAEQQIRQTGGGKPRGQR